MELRCEVVEYFTEIDFYIESLTGTYNIIGYVVILFYTVVAVCGLNYILQLHTLNVKIECVHTERC